jgi:ABC-type branched-subunit amino acid transport system substrate-binding protein
MRRAAELVAGNMVLDIRDTGGEASIAAREAAAAVKEGATMILGPVRSDAVRAAAGAAGEAVPVIGFSNDPTLLGTGATVFGVTPVQSVAAMLAHERNRGSRSVGVVAPKGAYGDAVVEATRLLAPRAGLEITGVGRGENELRAMLTGGIPDAVLLTLPSARLAPAAEALRRAGATRLLGTVQWLAQGVPDDPALVGAVVPSPDPATLAPFTTAYAQAHGEAPGLLAALAADATRLASAVTVGGTARRDVLYRAAGFEGMAGDYRLYPSGQCERTLDVFIIGNGGTLEPAFTGAA